MTYRTAAFVCPSCGEGLREFGTRLVCDRCDGILLSLEDFESQANAGEVRVVDDGGATRPCPRCERPMRGCVLVVRGRHLDQPLLRCERHGIWFGEGALAEVYEDIGTGGAGGPAQGDGGFGAFYGAGATPGLRTIRRTPRRALPRAPSAPVPPSALRALRLPCPNPGCRGRTLELDVSRWICIECKGLFVENAALEALALEMKSEPWQLPPLEGAPGTRLCPACAQPLTVTELEGETVDRCAVHGVWFDPTELEAALQHVAGAPARQGPPSWWRRLLFGELDPPG
jgi:Transcription factor zinc-finger